MFQESGVTASFKDQDQVLQNKHTKVFQGLENGYSRNSYNNSDKKVS